MKKKTKIKMEELQVESFVTSLDEKEMQTVQAGGSIARSIVVISKVASKIVTETIKTIPKSWCTVNVTCLSKRPEDC